MKNNEKSILENRKQRTHTTTRKSSLKKSRREKYIYEPPNVVASKRMFGGCIIQMSLLRSATVLRFIGARLQYLGVGIEFRDELKELFPPC